MLIVPLLLLLVITGCGKTLSKVTISGTITENGQAIDDGFPGCTVTLLQGGTSVDAITLAAGVKSWAFTKVSPGVYEVVGSADGRHAGITVDATSGSQQKVVLDFKTAVQIAGTVQELGRTPGTDWPSESYLILKNGDGRELQRQTITAGKESYSFTADPGKFQVVAESAGRQTATDVVDLTKTLSGSFALNFDEVVLYGDLLLSDGVTPGCMISVSRNGATVETISIPEGQKNYQFILSPGIYQLTVLSNYSGLDRLKGWRTTSRGYQLQQTVDVSSSRRKNVSFEQLVSLTGTFSEFGSALGADFPGGELEVWDGTRLVETKAMMASTSSYTFDLLPGKYKIVAKSYGRTLTISDIDLTNPDSTSGHSFKADFNDVVLHGTLSADEMTVPACTIGLKKDGNVLQTKTFAAGSGEYSFVVSPNTTYTLEIAIPALGAFSRKNVSVVRSKLRDLNLTEKVTISGRITENNLTPIAGEFPGGTIQLKTSDGIVRAMSEMSIEGGFLLQAYPNEYTVEAISEGRIETLPKDASSGSQTGIILNYTEVVFRGTIAMRDGTVPDTFPETTAEFIAGSTVAKTATVARGMNGFRAVVDPNSYNIRLTLKDTPVVITVPAGVINRSCKRTLNIDSKVTRVIGSVSTRLGTPEGTTFAKIYTSGGTLVDSKTVSSNYEFYLNPGAYIVALENSKYISVSRAVEANYDETCNLRFTHCRITFTITENPGYQYSVVDASGKEIFYYEGSGAHGKTITMTIDAALGVATFTITWENDRGMEQTRTWKAAFTEKGTYSFSQTGPD